MADVLEFEVEYADGNESLYLIDLIKDEDPRVVTHDVLSNDLGFLYNGAYCRWAHLYIMSLKLTIHILRHTTFEGP